MPNIPVVLKPAQHNAWVSIDALRKGCDGSYRKVPFAPAHVVLIELRVYKLVRRILVRLLLGVSRVALERDAVVSVDDMLTSR